MNTREVFMRFMVSGLLLVFACLDLWLFWREKRGRGL